MESSEGEETMRVKRGIFHVTSVELETASPGRRVDVDLEEALDIAGAGKYQLVHCALMAGILSSALIEMIGSAFVLPAAACDLHLPPALKGLLTGLPNIGIILTATLWGRAADALGRRPVLMATSAAAGLLGGVAAFMPNLVCYALCKLAGSLFLSCPTSLGFAYAAELLPHKRRDMALLVISSLLNLSSTLSPVLAWLILPAEWRADLGAITFRPWRLLTLVYATPLLIFAAWLTWADESPKFLVTKGRYQQALQVLRRVYAINSGKPATSYAVTSLKKQEHRELNQNPGRPESKEELTSPSPPKALTAMTLVKPPHVKWLALTGFLMFGIFSLLNGLFLFAPDTINKVMSGESDVEGTLCVIMKHEQGVHQGNETSPEPCNDKISTDTFSIMVYTTLVYSAIVMGASLAPISKKTILTVMYLMVGCSCLVSGLARARVLAALAMSALQLTAVGVGALTAYAVDLFPTALRGTAVGILLMFGRLGSLVGANLSGTLLDVACNATFYGFASLMFVCTLLCFALPKKNRPLSDENLVAIS